MNIIAEIDSTYYYQVGTPDMVDSHIDSTNYEPRIVRPPVISRTVGSAYFGVNNVDSVTLEFHNEDGYFDTIYSDFNNKPIVIKIGDGVLLSGYRTIFTGVTTEISRSTDTMTISCSDNKSQLNKNILFTYYSTATYPDLNTENAGKPIPQMWGSNIRMQCVCIDEVKSPTPANYTFKICDTSNNVLTSIDAVYLNDVVVTYANTNLTNGTFTIAAATLGTDNFNNVTASATNAMTNPVNIIQDIIDTRIAGFLWDSATNAATAAEGFITSYYQDSVVDILTAINEIMNDTNLLLFIDNLGIGKIKYFKSDRLPARVIKNHEWTDDYSVENNINEFVSSILITYSPWRSNPDRKKYHRVATYETEASSWYGDTKEIQIDTNLTNTTDAELRANKVLELSRIFRETYTRSIRLSELDNFAPFDFVAADPSARDVNIDPAIYDTYEVLGITDDYDIMTRQLTLRYISTYSFVNFFDILIDENLEEICDENLELIIMGDYLNG